MNIIAVDDERMALKALIRGIKDVAPEAEINGFSSPKEALEFAETTVIDVAFLDIEMGGMSGLILAKHLKELDPDINIIFVTAYMEYANHAFDMHASGYVLKPIMPERIRRELNNLRYKVIEPDKGVRAQCFGNFEIFKDGVPIAFNRQKSKEALAYLIDRKGAGVSNKELATVLWEDSEYTRTTQSHLRTILSEMMKSLEASGAADIVITQYNSRAIDTSKINCDYYKFIDKDSGAVNSYRGEYMTNYSWAEFTLGGLSHDDQ